MTGATERRDWEELAALDPFWAILSDPQKRFGGWDRDEFMASGERSVSQLLDACDGLGVPTGRTAALDFGCGAGRLTRPLASRFDRSVGVDVSSQMVSLANELHRDEPRCHFVLNDRDDLQRWPDGDFDLVVSQIVLQHVAGQQRILTYVAEMVRVLRGGGALVFQLPSSIPLRYRLQPTRRLYGALRAAGVSPKLLYRRLRLQPMRMTAISVEGIRSHLEANGATLLDTVSERTPAGLTSTTYYATRRPITVARR